MLKKSQKINSKYIGKYQIIKKIGEGSYAKIYKVKKDSSEICYVLKNIPVTEEDYSSMNEILNESSILSTCDNIYVIKYYDSFFCNGTFNIITEFCPYGDLFGYIKFYKVRGSKIEEKIIWIIFIQLSLGLNYLHQKKILHRDIKTKNIFIKDNLTVKIGDFGIAKILNSTSSYAHTFIGTPYYISPELCKDQPYNDKSDVWALGCVLYELCTLNHPFEGGTQVEIYEKIMTQKFKPISNQYSNDLKKTVDLLLEKDEKKRPKMIDILKMKFVLERAAKYNVEIDTYDSVENNINEINHNNIRDSIDEDKIKFRSLNNDISGIKRININNNNKYNLKNNSYNINISNNKDYSKYSPKKKKSPNNYSNKSKKIKNEFNRENDDNNNKNNRIKIDNILKNNQMKYNKNYNSNNKISLNKISNQINNQQHQYIKQYKEIINSDKINPSNIIKFTSPSPSHNNDINNKQAKNKENKVKSKIGKINSNKVMNKIEIKEKDKDINKEKELSQELSLSFNINSISAPNSKQKENNIINNKNNSNIIRLNSNSNSNNNYYYKKEAIFKKQMPQRNMNQILNKKSINNNIYNINYIIKSKTTNNKLNTNLNIMINNNEKNKNNINIQSNNEDSIIENENYLSDEDSLDNKNNNNSNNIKIKIQKNNSKIPKKIYLPSPIKSENKSSKNLKEFTLEKIPTQKLNNSFTLEQNKEDVKIYIESNKPLNSKTNQEVISENIKLQKFRDDTVKKMKKNENEMKSISYGVYQHVIRVYKEIAGDNKDITSLTQSLITYMRQNLIIKDDKESENLYKNFKRCFYNYILCEIELNKVESQIEKRKITGIWILNNDNGINNIDNNNINDINEI